MNIKDFLSNLLGKELKEKEPIANIAIEQVSKPLPTVDYELDEDQQELFDLIENTNQNIFIQGQAGTGKSTFINYLKTHSNKRIRVVCPTAVAAINIGGSTIHSLFNLPLSDFFIFDELIKTPRKKLKSILLKTDLLIIDEVSSRLYCYNNYNIFRSNLFLILRK